jgi:RING-variant domain
MEFESLDNRSLRGLVRSVSSHLLRKPSYDDVRRLGSEDAQEAEEEVELEVLECRVCKDGPSPNNRLYAPCLCNGSIMYTHEDCLQQWLAHSKKTR